MKKAGAERKLAGSEEADGLIWIKEFEQKETKVMKERNDTETEANHGFLARPVLLGLFFLIFFVSFVTFVTFCSTPF